MGAPRTTPPATMLQFEKGWFLLPDDWNGSVADGLRAFAEYLDDQETGPSTSQPKGYNTFTNWLAMLPSGRRFLGSVEVRKLIDAGTSDACWSKVKVIT